MVTIKDQRWHSGTLGIFLLSGPVIRRSPGAKRFPKLPGFHTIVKKRFLRREAIPSARGIPKNKLPILKTVPNFALAGK